MRTTEQVKADISALVTTLPKGDVKTTLAKVRELESELKAIERANLLKGVNTTQDGLRSAALLAWNCEQPTEDVTTNDGSFHKVKVKKYPNLAALQYARASFVDGRLMTIRIGRDSFNMFKTKHEYQKPTEYTRPATFNEFLELNCIMREPLTLEQYNATIEQLNEANATIEAQMKAYKEKLEALNISQLNYYGLINQQNTHFYKYDSK